MAIKKIDLTKEAILEEDLPNWPTSIGQPSISKATIEDYRENSVTIRVKLPQKGILVLTDSYYPDWKAEVDGQTTKIYLANYNFRAIVVPEGEHKIIFKYGN